MQEPARAELVHLFHPAFAPKVQGVRNFKNTKGDMFFDSAGLQVRFATFCCR
jgi:uncharacterized protein YdhG (YjbR/CyaY superfamily)